MKNEFIFHGYRLVSVLLLSGTTVQAQINSWTNSASGNWEDSYWSLGVLPGTNQTILFTNQGIKTLTIGTKTVQNFPDTLSVDSITISAPATSSNELVLRNAGPDSPLVVARDFTIDGNSAGEVYSSALDVGNGLHIRGSFILGDGILAANSLNIGDFSDGYAVNPGTFTQFGGYHTNGAIEIDGTYVGAHAEPVLPHYELSGGTLCTPSISLNIGGVVQSGGTNEAETIKIGSASDYILSGGWLLAQNVQDIGPPDYGASGEAGHFWQSGGTNQIGGNLLIDNSSAAWITGGRLIAQSVIINNYSAFYDYAGTVEIQLLSLGGGRAGGTWNEQSSGQKLGRLMLTGFNSGSFLVLPDQPCVLNFGDSSGLAWSSNTVLLIQNWSGSLYGGGNQQVIFGSNSAALTSQQLSQIQFQNPTGFPAGNYPARILATSEIVPDTGAPLPMKMTIAYCPINPAMQINLCGGIGQSYDIEVSTDLVNWTWWTNQFNSNGTISIPDCGATNYPTQFYRARLVP
jgi:hypothetical protein